MLYLTELDPFQVTFMEVLERERKKEGHRLVKFVSVFCGFLLLSLLEVAGER